MLRLLTMRPERIHGPGLRRYRRNILYSRLLPLFYLPRLVCTPLTTCNAGSLRAVSRQYFEPSWQPIRRDHPYAASITTALTNVNFTCKSLGAP